MHELAHIAAAAFRERFGGPPACVVFAPGRVNLIGEHLDYNGGQVLPMAISRGTAIAAAPNAAMRLSARSETLALSGEVPLPAPSPSHERNWLSYLAGVAAVLHRQGHPVSGADLVIVSDLPLGSGLSSSASFEMAAVKIFETLNHFQLEDADAARIGQRVEHEYLGLHSGIMDQFVVRAARAGHALLLDCATLRHEHIPFELQGTKLVIINSGVSRGLAASAYNDRVAACRRAAACLARHGGHSDAPLASFNIEDLDAVKDQLDEADYRCARHVISEQDRVLRACDALRQGDVATLGMLFNASHASLAEDYRVTGPVLDALHEKAVGLPGCRGARMTGAGFGGCLIALVDESRLPDFCTAFARHDRNAPPRLWECMVSDAANGVRLI